MVKNTIVPMLHLFGSRASEDLFTAVKKIAETRGRKKLVFAVEITPEGLNYLRGLSRKVAMQESLDKTFELLEKVERKQGLVFTLQLINVLEEQGAVIIPIDSKELARRRREETLKTARGRTQKSTMTKIFEDKKSEEHFSRKMNEIHSALTGGNWDSFNELILPEDTKKLKEFSPENTEVITLVGYKHAEAIKKRLDQQGFFQSTVAGKTKNTRIYGEWLKLKFLLWATRKARIHSEKNRRRITELLDGTLQNITRFLRESREHPDESEAIINETMNQIRRQISQGKIERQGINERLKEMIPEGMEQTQWKQRKQEIKQKWREWLARKPK